MKGLCTTCGKEISNIIIINTTPYSLAMYLDYKENAKGLCINCYMNKYVKKKDCL